MKIVVSPVRVRVSPLEEAPFRRGLSFLRLDVVPGVVLVAPSQPRLQSRQRLGCQDSARMLGWSPKYDSSDSPSRAK